MQRYIHLLLTSLWLVLVSFISLGYESTIGARVGVDFPTFSGVDYENELLGISNTGKIKPGFSGGIFYELRFNEQFSLQPELLFSMLGTKWGNATSFQSTIYANTLEVPIIACLKTELKWGLINLFAGLDANFAIGKLIQVNEPAGTKIDISSDFNRFSLGFIVGTSYALNFKIGLFLVDIRYMINIIPLYKKDIFGNIDTRQHNLTISLGYGYRLK
jgi:hypothetical protein